MKSPRDILFETLYELVLLCVFVGLLLSLFIDW